LPLAIDGLSIISNVEIIYIYRYYPLGVLEIIGRSSESFIGVLDEFTILKYLCIPGNDKGIRTEARLLEVVRSYPRIIALGGITEHGLVLQRTLNGSLNDYIATQPGISVARKIL
jgi:hypothetical protein